MTNEPEGRQQPSTEKEIPIPSPEIQLELQQLSRQNGQAVEILPETSEHPEPAVQSVDRTLRFTARSLDEAFAEGLDRKWTDFSVRHSSDFAPGDSIDITVKGHTVTAKREEYGISFSVAGHEGDRDFTQDFAERNSVQIAAALRVELEERAREEEKELERRAEASRARAEADVQARNAAMEHMAFLQRSQRNYDAQMKGDRYVLKQMSKGEDIER